MVRGKVRRCYQFKSQGAAALTEARDKVAELAGEIIDEAGDV